LIMWSGVGINTISLAGLSLFINGDWAKTIIPDFTDQAITKIEVDPSLSPEEAVRASTTILKPGGWMTASAISTEYYKKPTLRNGLIDSLDILDVMLLV